MPPEIGRKALKPNPVLKPLQALIGTWQTAGSHPYLPDTILRGRTTFEWGEGGAFLVMRTEIDHPSIPDGVAIFGSDDEAGTCFLLYFDERGVSRTYDVLLEETRLTWWRDNPAFSQRFILTMGGNNEMTGQGEMCQEGGKWEEDLSLTYTRIA